MMLGDLNLASWAMPGGSGVPPTNSPGTVQVSTPNTVVVTYAPPPPPPPFPPAKVPPKIRLSIGRLFAKQSMPFKIAPAAMPSVSSRVATTRIGTQPLPGLAQGAPQIGFEQREGLWVVSDGAVPILTGILGTMVWQPDAGGSEARLSDTGQAAFMIGQTGNMLSVIDQHVQAGFAVLIDKASITTGVPKIIFTNQPSVVAANAGGDQATHALINGSEPKTVIDGALKIIHGGAVPSSVVTKPNYLLYGAIGVGVLAAGYFVMKKQKHAVANRRRRR